MSLGERLKQARKAKKMTQKQLGDLTGVTGSAIGNYENGVSSPNEDTLILLMSVLGVDANYLYADDVKAVYDASFLSPEEERLVSLFRSLNAQGQQEVSRYADYCISKPEYQKNITKSAT